MVSCIVSCIAICALASVGYSFPVIEEQHEIGIPETIVGHEETLGHQIGLSQEIHELEPKLEAKIEPKHAVSYQSFHLENKNAVPIVIKTVHPPTFNQKHFSGIGESFGHGVSEIEPVDLKLHGI